MDTLNNMKVENIVEEEPRDDLISLQLREMRDLCDSNQDLTRLSSATQDAGYDVAQLRDDDAGHDVLELEECHLCHSVLRRGPAFFAHQGLPHPFPCLLQCGRHFPDLLLLHSHHLEHHRAPNMVAAAGLLFCPTCNQVWPTGSEVQHSPRHHLYCDLCPRVLQGDLKDHMVLHRWRAHGVTGDVNPGSSFQPAMPISSGSPTSTSHCSSASTTSTSSSPETENRLKRKLERGGNDEETLSGQVCSKVRSGVIEEELKRCRKVQEDGQSKKQHSVGADVVLENCLDQTRWFGDVLNQNCHKGKAPLPLEDGEIDASDELRVDVIGEKIGGGLQMMLRKKDLPYWCSLCNVRLPEDTPQARRIHNQGKRHKATLQEKTHQATLQEFKAKRLQMRGSGKEPESLQEQRISEDKQTTVSALARLGDKRSVVFVPEERRNVVERLGEKVLDTTPQRKVELLEDDQEQERLTDELSEELSFELDEEQGGDLRERLRDRGRRYRNLNKGRTYQDLDKVENSDRVVVEKRKAKDYGKELEELSTKIQRARYVQKSVKNRLADVSTSSKRVVTFGRRTEIFKCKCQKCKWSQL